MKKLLFLLLLAGVCQAETVVTITNGTTVAAALWKKQVIYGSAATNGTAVLASGFYCNLFARNTPWPVFTNAAAQPLRKYGSGDYLSNLVFGVDVPFASGTNILFTIRTNVIPASGMIPGLVAAGLTGTLRGSVSTPTWTNITGVSDLISQNEYVAIEIVPSARLEVTTNFWWSVEHWYQDN